MTGRSSPSPPGRSSARPASLAPTTAPRSRTNSSSGYAIERGTGKHGRYFEIAGVPRGLLDAFSSRSREVARAAERFRAKWGRAPERGELRQLKLENRKAKVLITRADLQQAWNDTAARFDFAAGSPGRPLGATVAPPPDRPLEDRVEQRLAALISTPAPTRSSSSGPRRGGAPSGPRTLPQPRGTCSARSSTRRAASRGGCKRRAPSRPAAS